MFLNPSCISTTLNLSKWTELIAKREGYGNYTPEKYMNEVLGESCGVGVQLVSMDELQKACVLNHENKPKQPEDCMQDLAIVQV